MKRYLPFLNWIQGYNKAKLMGDLPAGITVGIMLIPQGMAYAMIAGLPPVYGLYASLLPQIIYAFLGTSRQLAVGPVAMDSLLVAAGLSVIAVAGTENYIILAITLALLMGIMQLLMGVFRLGFLVNFLSKPVISGFTSAAALIIGFNQLSQLMGIPIERSNQLHILLADAFSKLGEIHWLTFAIGIGGIALIKLVKKFVPKLPAALMVVVVGILLVSGLNLTEYGVKIVGNIPEGFPSFSIPDLGSEHIMELLPVALTLALIAFMEAISVAKAVEQKHDDYEVDANQELIAIGASNIVGSFFQSYPTTGGFSRTAVNDQAGAKTGIAAIISALIVGLTLLFLTPLFYNLPKAVLASIIMVAVFGLIDIKYPKRLWKKRKDEFILLIFTFIITATVGIKEGILLGVLLSLLMLVYRTTQPHMAILGKVPGTNFFRNTSRFEKAKELENTLIIRFDAQLYFGNAEFFKKKMDEAMATRKTGLNRIVLSAEAINYIDSSAAHMLRQFIADRHKDNIEVSICAAIGPVRDILHRSEIIEMIGENNVYNNVEEATSRITLDCSYEESQRLKRIALQNNLKK